MTEENTYPRTGLILFCTAILLLGLGITRANPGPAESLQHFLLPALLWTVAIAAYLHILVRAERGIPALLGLSVLLRAVFVFHAPAFSDDHFRFLWDGHLWLQGRSVWGMLPSALAEDPSLFANEAWRGVYIQLNSPDYATVYPPLLQYLFRFAVWVSGDQPVGALFVMKLFAFAAECLSLWFIWRILKQTGKPLWWALLYALNPLVLLELNANLHWEVLMITGLLGMQYCILNEHWLKAGLFFALALSAKLIPLLLLPVLLKHLRLRDALQVSVIAVLCAAIPFFTEGLVHHPEQLTQSIGLYFTHFQFNASLFYLFHFLSGGRFHLWEGGLFGILYLLVLLLGFFFTRRGDKQNLTASAAIYLAGYYVFSATVHPWYLTGSIALAAISGLRFPVLWSCLLFFSYQSYYHERFTESWLFLWAEYLIVLPVLIWECLPAERQHLLFKKIWMQSLPLRVATKEKHLLPVIKRDGALLDIGCGYGGLTAALRQKGFVVEVCDIENRSLVQEVVPVLLQEGRLPYPENHFSQALLITVLHHTRQQEALLKEAARVSREIIVMEDVFRNPLQQQLTFFTDSLVNLEFRGHPHSNRREKEWEEMFERMGFRICYRQSFRTLLFFRQVVYVLEKPETQK